MNDEEEKRLSQCWGKEAYSSPDLANRVAKRRNRGHRRLNVYKCPFCHQWHMGSIQRYSRR